MYGRSMHRSRMTTTTACCTSCRIASQQAPDLEVVDESVKDQVRTVLDTLDAREAEVLRLYFGLGDDEAMTLEEIGTRFSLTRERVRQIKEKALRRLRHPRRRLQLEPLMESA